MAQDDAGDLLRRHNLRSTPQRRAILAAFRGTSTEHLSAEEVLARAASAVPDIGRGTVYATLAELGELGLLASVGSSDAVRYETNLAAHDHFHCRLCMRCSTSSSAGSRYAAGGWTASRSSGSRFGRRGSAAPAATICEAWTRVPPGFSPRPTLRDERISALACARSTARSAQLGMAASPSGIVRVAFADHADARCDLSPSTDPPRAAAARERLRAAAATLEGYFDGDRTPSVDLLDHLPDHHSDELLEAVRRIPYAESMSYELLGDVLSPYDCGRLLGSNPVALLVPVPSRQPRQRAAGVAYVGGGERLRFLHDLESPRRRG